MSKVAPASIKLSTTTAVFAPLVSKVSYAVNLFKVNQSSWVVAKLGVKNKLPALCFSGFVSEKYLLPLHTAE